MSFTTPICFQVLEAYQSEDKHPEKRLEERRKAEHQVIAMSLAGREASVIWGAIRNANLARTFFPAWTLTFYIADPSLQNKSLTIPGKVHSKLLSLEANLHIIPDNIALNTNHELWKYLVLADKNIAHVLFRDPRSRLLAKDHLTNHYFQRARWASILCVCDTTTVKQMLQDNKLNIKLDKLRILYKNYTQSDIIGWALQAANKPESSLLFLSHTLPEEVTKLLLLYPLQ